MWAMKLKRQKRGKRNPNINLNEDEGEEDKSKTSSRCLITNLPCILLLQILSRIPIKSIIQCKCVCKEWYNLILDPYFFDQYLTKSPFPTAGLLDCWNGKFMSDFFLLEFDEHHDIAMNQNSITPTRLRLPEAEVVGSCNGLLCLRRRLSNQDGVFYICNPILGEYITLPSHIIKGSTDYRQVIGMGSCNDKYKIIRSFVHKDVYPAKPECLILTVNVDSRWRRLKDASISRILQDCEGKCVAFNGRLHWAAKDYIVAFDVAEEKLVLISYPPPYYIWRLFYTKDLSVLGGYLTLVLFSHGQINLWCMKDYGVEESWTREVEIRSSSLKSITNFRFSSPHFYPIEICRGRKILFINFNWLSVSYDRKNGGNLIEFRALDKRGNFTGIDFVPNLRSLHSIFQGGGFRIHNVKSRTTTFDQKKKKKTTTTALK